LTDTVADFLTRVRNAIHADREQVVVPASNMNRELARVLQQEGYIDDFGVEKTDKPPGASSNSKTTAEFEALRITLRYTEDRESVISGLRRISKPGRRQYADADSLPRVLGGMGTAILTTSKGVMTAYEARRQRVGGEILAHIW
jgi:small subunit ribosomal protein S8